jgi:hypothetical protein
VLFLPKWLTQRDMDCCIKIVINSGYLTNDYGTGSFFQESLSTVFNKLFSGSRAFAVWSSLSNISCCFEFKRVYFYLNG